MFKNIGFKKLIILIFLLSFIIRLIFAFQAYKLDVMKNFSDDKAYINFANNVIKQGPFVPDIQKLDPSARVVGPGIAWIMAIIMIVFGKSWLSIFIINALIGSITSVIILLIANKLFNKPVAFIAGLISSFYMLFIKYVPTSGKEIWMTFIFSLIVLFLIKLINESKNKYIFNTFIIAVLYSILIHIDERYFAYFPVIIGFILFLGMAKFINRLKFTVLYSVIVIIFMLPWLYRNYNVYNRVIILSVRTAKFTEKLFGYSHIEYFKKHENKWFLSKTQIDSVKNFGIRVKLRTGRRISQEQVKAIQSGVLPHKFTKYETWFASFKNLWEPIDITYGYYETGYRFDGKWSLKHNLVQGLTYGLLLIFSFLGFFFYFKKNIKITLMFLIILTFHTLIHVLFIPFTNNRYRIPIDFIIIIFGVYGMFVFYNRYIKNIFKDKREVL